MLNMGTTGAKVQSWHKKNARELLAKLVREHPRDSEEKLLERFNADCDDYRDEIVRYWFVNNYRALTQALEQTSTPLHARRVAAAEKKAARAKTIIAAKVREIALLDLVQPNGKRLSDCTGAECSTMADTVAPWLRSIAARVKPKETVGEALGENDVVALWRVALSKAQRAK